MNTYDAPARRSELRAGYRQLHQLLPDQMRGFGDLHRSAMADGALTTAQKELIALAVAMTQNCDGCIAYHVKDALEAYGTDFTTDWNETMWPSAGPFVFDTWQKGEFIKVVRNENYWKTDTDDNPLPYLDAIEYRFGPCRREDIDNRKW